MGKCQDQMVQVLVIPFMLCKKLSPFKSRRQNLQIYLTFVKMFKLLPHYSSTALQTQVCYFKTLRRFDLCSNYLHTL